jgi:hypothetical protein
MCPFSNSRLRYLFLHWTVIAPWLLFIGLSMFEVTGRLHFGDNFVVVDVVCNVETS